jgi:hypothetical protein
VQVTETAPTYFPLGVADPSRQLGFARGSAVRLTTGEIVWQVGEDALIASEGLLATMEVERANVFRVARYDLDQHGALLGVSQPVVLPEWVAVSSATFKLDVRLRDGHVLVLRWRAHAYYAGGAAPPSFVIDAARRETAGTAVVVLHSGEVLYEPADDTPEPAPQKLEVSVTGQQRQQLRLRTSDGELVNLLEGNRLVTEVTPDGAHVFVYEDLPSEGRWWVFAGQTGQHIATLTHVPGAREPRIIAENGYYLVGQQPLMLGSRELATDRLRWEVSLPGRPIAEAPPPRP